MTIQERLKRSNLIMLVAPIVIAGILLGAVLLLALEGMKKLLEPGGPRRRAAEQ